MKKYKARKEREQLEAIVRPRLEIADPSAELFSDERPWDHEDPLQDSFLEQPEILPPPKDYHRVPRLRFRCTSETPSAQQSLSSTQKDASDDQSGSSSQAGSDSDTSSSEESVVQVTTSSKNYDAAPEVIGEKLSQRSPAASQPPYEQTPAIPIRSRSLPPSRDLYQLAISPPNFQIFSQRCAPSPTSASPLANTPIFELSAEEAIYSTMNATSADSPVELEGSPVESKTFQPSPLSVQNLHGPETEPEASPYSRFTVFAKSIHALNANLSPIEETEEEAASRRSSAQIFELPAIAPLNPIAQSAYSGGTSISQRNQRTGPNTTSDPSAPARNISTRSSNSTISSNSLHSIFSFEFSNSDTEKIYVSAPTDVRKSSAPSLTDVSSVDDFDIDLDLDLEARRSRSVSKRDAKLERFFGIRQYSISSESENSDAQASQPTIPESILDAYRRNEIPLKASHRPSRSSISIDDIDLSLALESDPHKRELMSMHKSILFKSQSKQDAKLEKFFGCNKDVIQVARKCSTGSRLAGHTDDLKYRSIGW